VADYVNITGVPPWDGRYELDLDGQPLTTTEWGWVKRRAGYLPLTLTGEAFADPELIAVLAAIAVRRAGTLEPREVEGFIDRLFDAPFGNTITLEAGDTAGDADPPPESNAAKLSSNGASSTNGSESSAILPPPTGVPASATSASAPPTSVT
jgi:hypothetical protein